MTNSPDRLYNLLPAIHRMRDEEQGLALRALLQVITSQVDLVEADIAQLYDNWFIETCQDWVVPYIADLIGYRSVISTVEMTASAQNQQRAAISTPRREVANTIRYRRRKGALALLELLSADVANWPARAVEFYRLLGISQHSSFVNVERGRTADLRRGDVLDRLNGPFDELAHTVDVRRLDSQRMHGRYNIASVGLFVWRLKPYSISHAPAYCIDRVKSFYTFSMLGNATQLVTLPQAEPLLSQIAGELNVPAAIRRRAFDDQLIDYYGAGKSLQIWRDSFDQPIPADQIVPADLSDWRYRPQDNQVAVDPVLGRIAFATRNAPKQGVWVTYHHAFSDDLGGGEYPRMLKPVGERAYYPVRSDGQSAPNVAARLPATNTSRVYPSIKDALAAWRDEKPASAVIEILDSGAYVEQIEIRLEPNQRLELRAADRCRPVVRLLDFYTNRPDALQIIGPDTLQDQEKAPRITINGLLITGRSIQVSGRLSALVIRHSTLVPGWTIGQDCHPENEEEPSLELDDTAARVTIERSILGTIRINENEVGHEPIQLSLADSILDATRSDLAALDSRYGAVAHARATFIRCTIVGQVFAHAIELAENTIFDGEVKVARRQIGCMRFCYVPHGSRTPRRYNCQPDGVAAEKDTSAVAQRERERVRPQFHSRRYGAPTYCQLAPGCAPEISRGAEDESEMGAFHDLFQPQREANLRVRLDEYTPAGVDAGIIFVT